MAAAETNGLMLSKPWFTSTPGQADLASPDNGVSVDDVLEVIPELVEERARARVEVPGQKKDWWWGTCSAFSMAPYMSASSKESHISSIGKSGPKTLSLAMTKRSN